MQIIRLTSFTLNEDNTSVHLHSAIVVTIDLWILSSSFFGCDFIPDKGKRKAVHGQTYYRHRGFQEAETIGTWW